MKLGKFKYNISALLIGMSACYSSCSLDEFNPSGSTLETVSSASIKGYEGILNNIYFGMERRLYGYSEWTVFTEAGTDIWDYAKGQGNNYFNYGLGGGWNLNMMLNTLFYN